MGARNSKEKSKVTNDVPESNEDDFISFLDAASDGNFDDKKGVMEIYEDEKKTNLLR